MALWGKIDAQVITGTAAISENETTVTGTATEFMDEINAHDIVVMDDNSYRVRNIVSDTEMEVEPISNVTLLDQAITLRTVPKYLPLSVALEDAVFISTEEAQVEANRVQGIRTPGWHVYEEYLDQHGNTRRRIDTQIVMKSAQAESGDFDDFVTE